MIILVSLSTGWNKKIGEQSQSQSRQYCSTGHTKGNIGKSKIRKEEKEALVEMKKKMRGENMGHQV